MPRARMLALIVVGGCWTTPPPPPPVVAASTSPRPLVRPKRGIPAHSVWRGTYICAQGLTAVTLTLHAKPSGETRARFDFGPVPSNPTVPPGAFEMTGHLRATGRGRFAGALEPAHWIDQPPGYVMVAIEIEARGLRMTGTIQSRSCSDFKVRRVD